MKKKVARKVVKGVESKKSSAGKFTRSQMQEELLKILLKGGPLILASQQVETTVFEVFDWLDEDEEFRRRYQQVQRALDHTIFAKLYQEAVNGSLPATTFWIKDRNPIDWRCVEESEEETWSDYSDEEIFRRAEEEKLALPRGFATRGVATGCGALAGGVSSRAENASGG